MVSAEKGEAVPEEEPAFEDFPLDDEIEETPQPRVSIPMNIAEAEHTIQGEGILIGTQSLIIKMIGCNMKCTYCYVKKKRPDRVFNMDTIVRMLEDYCDIDLVITGGEPFMQPDALGYIINKALAIRREVGSISNVTVETNGTVSPQVLKLTRFDESRVSDEDLNSVLFTVSPKLHSSGEEWSKTKFSDFMKLRNIQFKLIVNPFDPDDIIDMQRVISFMPNEMNIVVAPVIPLNLDDYDFDGFQRLLNELCKLLIDNGITKARLIPQVQRVIWGLQRV
jgi:organic radical activating enzyme